MFNNSIIILGLLGISIVALAIVYISVKISNSVTKNIVNNKDENS